MMVREITQKAGKKQPKTGVHEEIAHVQALHQQGLKNGHRRLEITDQLLLCDVNQRCV